MFKSIPIGTGPDGPINQLQANFAGMNVIVSDTCLEVTKERLFPVSKHRSKRVHKKLVKRFGGEFRKVPAVFKSGNTIYIHPNLKGRLEAAMAKRIDDKCFDMLMGRGF